MDYYKIAISGELGSGKTVLGKLLSDRLGFSLISIGSVQRTLAEEHGMTTIEFNKYMESHPEIDQEIDKKVEEYGKSNVNLILDSRVAWYFVPQAFKLHLIVDMNIAATRIFKDNVRKNENNKSLQDTIDNIIIRKESEVKRFKNQYDIDINDIKNYNIIIDTSFVSPEFLTDFLIERFEEWKNQKLIAKVWISPKIIFPTQSIREHSLKYQERFQGFFKKTWCDSNLIRVIKWKQYFFMFDGHKRCSKAIKNNTFLIPVEIVNAGNYILPNGQTIDEYIKDNYILKNIYDWEDMHNFQFTNYYQN